MFRHFDSITVNEPSQLIKKLNEWDDKFNYVRIHSYHMGLTDLQIPVLIYVVEFTFDTEKEKEEFIKILHPKKSNLNLA